MEGRALDRAIQQLLDRLGLTVVPTLHDTAVTHSGGAGHADRPAGKLLERARELSALAAAVQGVREGQGQVLLIEGAPRGGKSALLWAAGRLASAGGLDVLEAAARPGSPEFAVAATLLRARIARATLAQRETLLRGPAARALDVLEPGEAPADPLSAIHGLLWLSAHLAAERALALLVDDVQWADEPSLSFLLHLAEHAHDLPLLVVVAGRPDEGSSRASALPELRRLPVTGTLALAPLSRDAVEALAGAQAAKLYAAVGGSPGLVLDLVGEAASLTEPQLVRRAHELRLVGLSDTARAALRAVAVLAPQADLTHVADLAGLPAADAGLAVGELVAAGLVTRRLAVDLVDQRLAEAVLTESAEALHRRAALLRADTAPERAAEHLGHCSPTGEPRVNDVLRRAAAIALSRPDAHTAARHLERALLEPPPSGELTPTLLELAHAQAAAGDARASSTFRAALPSVPPGERRVRLLGEMGRADFYAGDFAAALATFTTALRELDEPDGLLGAELTASLALTGVLATGDVREAALAEVRQRVPVDRAPRFGAERALLAALATQAAVRDLDRPGSLDLALRAWGDGSFLAERQPEVVLNMLSGVLAFGDRHDVALGILEAGRDAAAAEGQTTSLAMCSYSCAQTRWRIGDVTGAAADAQRALDVGEHGWFATAARATLAVAQLEAGEPALAQEIVRAKTALVEPWGAAVFLETRALCALALGLHEKAAEDFAECGRLHRDVLDADNPAKSRWRSGLSRCLYELGRRDESIVLAREELELARRWGAPSTVGAALATAGYVERDEAALAEAVELLGQAPARLTLAQALLDQGRLVRERSGAEAAREPLRRALDVAESAGGMRLADAARAELVAAGGRPRRGRTTGADSLTPGELRVVELAARGLTNREIADELFVTTKAVRWHLGNAYRKLGISSREELAQWVAPDG